MKLYVAGDKSKALCDVDGLVGTTFAYRDVPFDDGSGVVHDILVGVCDECGKVVSIPPQSTPAIKAARDRSDVPLEAMLPAAYLDALSLACYRIDPNTSPDFRKRLLMFYVHEFATDRAKSAQIACLFQETLQLFAGSEQAAKRKRLSMKISPRISSEFDDLVRSAKLSKTDVIKSMIGQIRKDIVEPKRPKQLKALQALAAVA